MKISDAKIEANRRNAARSTGPRTSTGKSRVAANALKHGAYASGNVIPPIGEDTAAYRQFLESFHDHFQPGNPVEATLVEEFANAQWRLRRIRRAEAGHFDSLCSELYDKSLIADGGETFSPSYGEWSEPGRGENRLIGDAVAISCAGVNVLSSLSRYEARLRHASYRALDRLEEMRLRETRSDGNKPTTPIDSTAPSGEAA